MPQMFKSIIFVSFFCVFYPSNAQVSNPKKMILPKSTPLELQEKRVIADAFSLLNKNEDKKAYKTAHRLLKGSKIKASLTNSNLLLAFYFNKRSQIDSSLFYTHQALRLNPIANDSLTCRLYSL